jgi:hypothetical protein
MVLVVEPALREKLYLDVDTPIVLPQELIQGSILCPKRSVLVPQAIQQTPRVSDPHDVAPPMTTGVGQGDTEERVRVAKAIDAVRVFEAARELVELERSVRGHGQASWPSSLAVARPADAKVQPLDVAPGVVVGRHGGAPEVVPWCTSEVQTMHAAVR